MASLGYYLLLAAFVVCAYAAAISVATVDRSRLGDSLTLELLQGFADRGGCAG